MPSVFLKSDTSVTASANALTLPSPEVIVNFRPLDTYKGEFGFDWVRMNDTPLFGDNKYEDIISKQYLTAAHTTLQPNGNKYDGVYKKDPAMYKLLLKKYNPFSLSWASKDAAGVETPAQYLVPWMSLYKDKSAKLKMKLVIDRKADYIEFDATEYYTITPNKIEIKGKSGEVDLPDEIEIKCIKVHGSDEELVVRSFIEGDTTGVVSGKIKAWANSSAKQKEKKVVFVQVKTPELVPSKGERSVDASPEKARINKYINQALITLHADSKVVDLDCTTDADFANYIKSKKVSSKNKTAGGDDLITYLKAKLKKDLAGKYDNFFKAFYFGENGYHANGNLSGYSRFGADFVVVFLSANDQTASHEFLHSFNLAHTFTNKETSAHAEFTYEYSKTDNLLDYSHHVKKNGRCSLWYWQWVKANGSL